MEEPAIMLVLIVTRGCCRGSILTPSRRNIANFEDLIFYFRWQMTPLGLGFCWLKVTSNVINWPTSDWRKGSCISNKVQPVERSDRTVVRCYEYESFILRFHRRWPDLRLVCSTEFVPEHTRGVKIISKNEALRVRRRANYEDNIKLDLTK